MLPNLVPFTVQSALLQMDGLESITFGRLKSKKILDDPPAHSPAGQQWGHLRGTPGRLPSTHTSMQGRADEQKHANSVASGGSPERSRRPLASPHSGPSRSPPPPQPRPQPPSNTRTHKQCQLQPHKFAFFAFSTPA